MSLIIDVHSEIKLESFDLVHAEAFFKAIHLHDLKNDAFLQQYQLKYFNQEKVFHRLTDAILNKYKIDGTPDFFIFVIGEIAGVFEFHPLSEDDFLEIGFWLFPLFRQRGVLSKIMPVMIKWAKEHFPARKLKATTLISNIPSQKLLENFQFARSSHLIEEIQSDGLVATYLEYYLK